MKILFGISLTLNVISAILFFIIYKYGFKGLKRKLENYALDLMDLDNDFIKNINITDIKRSDLDDYQPISEFSKSLRK